MISLIHNYILSVNNSKFFAGIIMLIMNIGSRYIALNFSKTQEEFIKNLLFRELLIFSIVWMATKDIYISLTLTASFIILADYILNEKSNYCLLPKKYNNSNFIDFNDDGIITENEIKKAEQLLIKASKQHNKVNHLNVSSYVMHNIDNNIDYNTNTNYGLIS